MLGLQHNNHSSHYLPTDGIALGVISLMHWLVISSHGFSHFCYSLHLVALRRLNWIGTQPLTFLKVCPGQGANPGSFWFLFIFSPPNSAVDHSATAPRLLGKRVHYPSRHSLLGYHCVIYLEVPVARTNFNTDKKKLGTHPCKRHHEVVPNQRVFLEGPGPQIFVARTAATAATVRIVT